jgi:hypothetical protein
MDLAEKNKRDKHPSLIVQGFSDEEKGAQN